MTSEAPEAMDVQVAGYGWMLLPHESQDKIGISPHDRLTVGMTGDALY